MLVSSRRLWHPISAGNKSHAKEMMPIVNKPLIQYGVEEAINADLNYIGFISGRGKRAIEDHFDISFELEHQIAGTSKEDQMVDIRDVIDKCTFSYTRQKEMRGLGDAILTGEELIGEEPFAVLLADDLCINGDDGVLLQMVRLYRKFHGRRFDCGSFEGFVAATNYVFETMHCQ